MSISLGLYFGSGDNSQRQPGMKSSQGCLSLTNFFHFRDWPQTHYHTSASRFTQCLSSLQRSDFYGALSKKDAPGCGTDQVVPMALTLESLVGKHWAQKHKVSTQPHLSVKREGALPAWYPDITVVSGALPAGSPKQLNSEPPECRGHGQTLRQVTAFCPRKLIHSGSGSC